MNSLPPEEIHVTAHGVAEGIACIWEAIINMRDDPRVAAMLLEVGWAASRSYYIQFAIGMEIAYQHAKNTHSYDDPYDWEFVPQILDIMMDDKGHLPFDIGLWLEAAEQLTNSATRKLH